MGCITRKRRERRTAVTQPAIIEVTEVVIVEPTPTVEVTDEGLTITEEAVFVEKVLQVEKKKAKKPAKKFSADPTEEEG
jgi:hypothetical protein